MIIEGIIGQLIGFGASAIESGFDYFKTKENNRHAIEMAKLGHEHKTAEYAQAADDNEHIRVLEHSKSITDRLRSSVRPILTYASFLFVSFISTAILADWMDGFGTTAKQEIIAYAFAMANTMIGYWFGNRNRDKMLELMRIKR